MPPKKKRELEVTNDKIESSNGSKTIDAPTNNKVGTSGHNWKWNKTSTLIYGDCGTKPNSKIVGFDMDDTLIKTKSGAKFPKDSKDWVFWHEKVVPKLNEWFNKGFKIVIFTNQNGISKGHTTEAQIKQKIEDISKQIGFPIQALIASADDSYRKPSKSLWNFFVENMNDKEDVDMKNSIYCGDAAGRLKPKKDFNDTDLKFALNVGIEFQVPEEFFLGEKQKIPKPDFDPKKIPKTGAIFKETPDNDMKNSKGVKEMIIFMGSPASGKSTFWQTHLSSYARINRDTLKTREKCLKVAEETMSKGQNLVIDNTNPSARDRKDFIDLAKSHGYEVRGFVFELTKDLAFHLNTLREINPHRKHLSGRIPPVPIHTFFKNFEKPTLKEGFSELKTVNFIAGPFENKDDEDTFFSFAKGKK